MDHARKLKFSIYVQPPSINKMFQYCYALAILYSVEVIIFEHGCYISALEYNDVNIKQLCSCSMYKHNL